MSTDLLHANEMAITLKTIEISETPESYGNSFIITGVLSGSQERKVVGRL